MSKGKRYSGEEKLNYKKVLAVVIAIIVFIMCIIMIKSVVSNGNRNKGTKQETNYYALYENNLWGIVASNGEKVIEPMYQEMLVVVDESKDVFLCTYDINEEDGTYKTKVVNKKNEMIFTKYNKVEALENIDSNGNLWYEENVLKVEQNGKYGLINLDGNEIIAPIYEQIYTLKGVKNSFIIKQDGVYGLVNSTGRIVVPTKYKEITSVDDEDYTKGYITIDENDKYGLISSSGETVLESKYEKIHNIVSDDYFVIDEDGKQYVINKSGEKLPLDGYDQITQITTSGIIFVKDNKYGEFAFDGTTKIKPIYESLKEINKDVFKAQLNDKFGLIDLEENIKLPYEYIDIYYNKDANIYIAENSDFTSSIVNSNYEIKVVGIISELNKENKYMKIKLDNEYKYYNFKFEEKQAKDILTSNTLYVSKKNDKYGFVNEKNEVVVDYIYDDATEQNSYGYAAIKKDGLWGAIDSKGNIVIEPKYNLDDNLVIDFIGKWHLGEDLNMNYYCEK